MTGRRRRGSSTIEMTLVGIPLIFILISVFEMSRGMWMYQTMSFAVKNGIRYAIVHGINCVNTADVPNNCSISIAQIATRIRGSAGGVDPTVTELIFTTSDGTATSCYLGTPGGSPPYGALSGACSTQASTWPTDDGTNDQVGKLVKIEMRTPFYTSLSMFWPGRDRPVGFALTNFYASSQDYIQF
jgi:hypothetical protein